MAKDTGQRIACFIKEGRYKSRLHVSFNLPAVVYNSAVALAAVLPTHPRAIPLAVITIRNFPFFPSRVWGSVWRPFRPPELRYHQKQSETTS